MLDWSAASVRAKIEQGTAWLLGVVIDEAQVGVLVVAITSTRAGKALDVEAVNFRGRGDWAPMVDRIATDLARMSGCALVRMTSPRPLHRLTLARRLGYQHAETTLVKVVADAEV